MPFKLLALKNNDVGPGERLFLAPSTYRGFGWMSKGRRHDGTTLHEFLLASGTTADLEGGGPYADPQRGRLCLLPRGRLYCEENGHVSAIESKDCIALRFPRQLLFQCGQPVPEPMIELGSVSTHAVTNHKHKI